MTNYNNGNGLMLPPSTPRSSRSVNKIAASVFGGLSGSGTNVVNGNSYASQLLKKPMNNINEFQPAGGNRRRYKDVNAISGTKKDDDKFKKFTVEKKVTFCTSSDLFSKFYLMLILVVLIGMLLIRMVVPMVVYAG